MFFMIYVWIKYSGMELLSDVCNGSYVFGREFLYILSGRSYILFKCL